MLPDDVTGLPLEAMPVPSVTETDVTPSTTPMELLMPAASDDCIIVSTAEDTVKFAIIIVV